MSLFHCRNSGEDETSAALGSFPTQMKSTRTNITESELHAMDRQVIQVNMPSAHAGITAALRRAFEAAASDPSDRDFAELLRRLN